MILKGGLLFVAVIASFAVAFGLAIYSIIHRREETFEGVVTDKDVRENVNNNNNFPGQNQSMITIGSSTVTHTYLIRVKTDAGKELSYRVSEGQYQIINIGDRVAKQKGTTEVQIVQKAVATGAPTQAPTGQPAAAVTASTQEPPVPPTSTIAN